MWYNNLGRTFFHLVTIHAFDRQTDRQTAFLCLDRVACNAYSTVKSPTGTGNLLKKTRSDVTSVGTEVYLVRFSWVIILSRWRCETSWQWSRCKVLSNVLWRNAVNCSCKYSTCEPTCASLSFASAIFFETSWLSDLSVNTLSSSPSDLCIYQRRFTNLAFGMYVHCTSLHREHKLFE